MNNTVCWSCGVENVAGGRGCTTPCHYALLQIQLFSKSGTLKEKTDCAPNNGYFLIPVYDKVLLLFSMNLFALHVLNGWYVITVCVRVCLCVCVCDDCVYAHVCMYVCVYRVSTH